MTQNVALSPKQVAAIDALMTGCTMTAAAERAGVTRKTLQRWMQEDGFRAALVWAGADAMQGVSRRLVAASQAAMDALEDALLEDKPIQARIRAADAILGRLLAVRELVDIEARLQALEGGRDAQ